MDKVTSIKDIWKLDIEKANETKGVKYASKSIPWTFNRMGIQDGDWTWYYRMMKISVGVMVQESLLKKLKEKGVQIEKQWKNYRTEDTFDLTPPSGIKIDVKSFNHYVEYDGKIRPEFSLNYMMENKSYSGNEWSKFFPWLIPYDQRKREDLFIFAVLSSPNYIKKKLGDRDRNFILTSPPMGWGFFFNNKKIILKREEEGKFLDLKFKLVGNSSLSQDPIDFTIGYEAGAKFHEEKISLKNGKQTAVNGASSLAYIKIDRKNLAAFNGQLRVYFENNLRKPILSGAKMVDLNRPPEEFWAVNKSMFGDLYLPKPANLYFIGWITSEEAEKRRVTYPSYAHPLDKIDKRLNQKGNSNEGSLMFPRSCCYVYPNTHRGGLKNKNFYVLTSDLNTMDSLLEGLLKA
jgi:hypothetical protein